MAGILIAILVYARALGTDELTEAAAMTAPAVGHGRRSVPARVGPVRRVTKLVDRWLVPVFVFLALFYLILPIAGDDRRSRFNDPPGRFNFVWGQFSLAAWENPFGRPGLQAAIPTSLVVAVVSTLIATTLGTLIALALSRYELPRPVRRRACSSSSRWRRPEIVLGASLLTLFVGTAIEP